MDGLARKYLRSSMLCHGRTPKCSPVNINSAKGCKGTSFCNKKSTARSMSRTRLASVASVDANVAEQGEARASNGALPPALQEKDVPGPTPNNSTPTPEAPAHTLEASAPTPEASTPTPGASSPVPEASSSGTPEASSTPESSSTPEGSTSKVRAAADGVKPANRSQGQGNPYRAQGSLRPFQPGQQQEQRMRSDRQGKVWRDPKSMSRGNQPTSNRNNTNRMEFSLNQAVWQNRKLNSSRKSGLVKEFPYKVGDRVVGTVVGGTNGWRVALEYDENILGFCSIIELPHVIRDAMDNGVAWDTTKVGLKREFRICDIPEDLQYNGRGPLLSARLIDTDVVWGRARQLQKTCVEDRDHIMVHIRTSNTGGVLGFFEGLPLFVPWSFLPRRVGGAVGSKEELIRTTVGSNIPIMIYDVDQQFNRFVGNNVQALNVKAINSLKIGDLAWGYVNNLTNFGAFLTLDNLPSLSALLHIRNVSQVHVSNIEDIFRVGDKVRVVVIGVDTKDNKLSLSTAELESYPGEMEQNKEKVFENAEEAVKGYREYVAQEQERLRGQKAGQGQARQQPTDGISYASDEDMAAVTDEELNW